MKHLLLLALLATHQVATAQHVGIGTTSPLGQLMISGGGNINTPQLYLRQTNNDFSRLRLQTGSSRFWDVAGYNGATAANDLLNIYNSTSGDLLSITGAGLVGIGTTTPNSRLHVNGRITSQSLTITGTGDTYDYLIRSNSSGDVGSRKGFGALGIKYCIALEGIYPPRNSNDPVLNGFEPYIGEIMLFAGNFPPRGWAFCEGQLLPIIQNTALFSILGTTYGGNGTTTFALPDLRAAVPVHAGVPLSGPTWLQGERVN